MSRKGWGLFALVGVLWGVPYMFMKIAVAELVLANQGAIEKRVNPSS